MDGVSAFAVRHCGDFQAEGRYRIHQALEIGNHGRAPQF
jgi:hypothetical protein